ncbi:MAG: ribonuclease HI, partial [Acidimicrobiia bacterium]|nr:ribonuclease HI [Acidimicrobiia bacterium]
MSGSWWTNPSKITRRCFHSRRADGTFAESRHQLPAGDNPPDHAGTTFQPIATAAYTDGACLGNPGPGGWAWAVDDGPYASGAAAHTTNQRMEIAAVLGAVRALPDPLLVVSDSTYVVNCFRDRWWEGWMKRGWKNSKKEPVANRDLWEPLIELVRERGVEFRWVKGHSGDRMNDVVDRLAVQAATKQEGRSGMGTPAELGAADDPEARSAPPAAGERDPRLPAGHLVLVGGLRPPELGGYDPNP